MYFCDNPITSGFNATKRIFQDGLEKQMVLEIDWRHLSRLDNAKNLPPNL